MLFCRHLQGHLGDLGTLHGVGVGHGSSRCTTAWFRMSQRDVPGCTLREYSFRCPFTQFLGNPSNCVVELGMRCLTCFVVDTTGPPCHRICESSLLPAQMRCAHFTQTYCRLQLGQPCQRSFVIWRESSLCGLVPHMHWALQPLSLFVAGYPRYDHESSPRLKDTSKQVYIEFRLLGDGPSC
jgi:hypothetical protein